MLLSDIRQQLVQAEKNVKTIAPKIKYHIVVMVGHCYQFQVELFEKGNPLAVTFFKFPEIFAKPPRQKLFDDFIQHQQLFEPIKNLEELIAKTGLSAKTSEWLKFDVAFSSAFKKKDVEEIERLKKECAERSMKAERDATKELDLQKCQLKNMLENLYQTLSTELERQEFREAQCELRFDSLQMDVIQELKIHPIVKEIGKTNISPASIRVVVG